MNKRYFLLLNATLFLFVLVLLAQCKNVSRETGTEGKEMVRIGAILPLTGDYDDLGNWVNAGLVLAVEELNSDDSSRFHYVLLVEDTKSQTSAVASGYNKLVNIDGVDIVFTTSSSASLAIKEQALRDSILLLSIASHPEITANNNGLIIRPCNTSQEETEALLSYVATIDDEKKVSVLYHNSEYGLSFNQKIKEGLGERVLSTEPYEDQVEGMRTVAAKLKASSPDVVLAIGFTPSLGLAIKALREVGYQGEILANIGITTPSVMNAIGGDKTNIRHVDYELPRTDLKYRKLDSLAQDELNTSFSSMSYLAFFSVKMLDQTIQEIHSTDAKQIAKQMIQPGETTIEGITLVSNGKGDLLPVLRVKDLE